MPVIKSAIKKLRQDKKREKQNDDLRSALKSSIRTAKKSKSGKSVAKAISTVDKAAKNRIIHANKAARLKSTLAKISKPASTKETVKAAPKAVKKVAKITKPPVKKKTSPKK